MNSRRVPRAEEASAATVDELLSIAERLFAEQGVENVALNQIVAASTQKNRSALHYHFGSRIGLLTAVLERRLAPINKRRHALLDALPANAEPYHIVRATVGALGDAVIEEYWGADYLRILAQVTFHPRLLGGKDVTRWSRSAMRRCRRLLEEALPDMEPEQLRLRLEWVIDCVVFAMARWLRDTPSAKGSLAGMNELMDELAVFGAAGLTGADSRAR